MRKLLLAVTAAIALLVGLYGRIAEPMAAPVAEQGVPTALTPTVASHP